MSESANAPRRISPCSHTIDAAVDLPGSKSITNRALLLAALADGESILRGALDSDDTRAMLGALTALGVGVERDASAATIRVAGRGAFPAPSAAVWAASSGTTARFLTAALALSPGRYTLDGSGQMRRRPLGDLIDALAMLGAHVDCAGGFLPLTTGEFIPHRGEKLSCRVRGSISSQFLSALLMASPLAGGRLEITVAEPIVSRPYIEMTAAMMRSFGCALEADASCARFEIPEGAAYSPREYDIEPDASAASYFFALAAILGGRVTVKRLSRAALQGDVGFVDCLAAMGCDVIEEENALSVLRDVNRPLRGIDVDMNAISDTAQTLSVVALF
ncbi:MAG: 3-phosphoshikimate 1-carboxyvinyltransferase, partial [Thermoguttaceae bacterium]|nr:3-phosphoshikimate 1-carboxyvinyltransferase [Thermoguttaceae bacterium]